MTSLQGSTWHLGEGPREAWPSLGGGRQAGAEPSEEQGWGCNSIHVTVVVVNVHSRMTIAYLETCRDRALGSAMHNVDLVRIGSYMDGLLRGGHPTANSV